MPADQITRRRFCKSASRVFAFTLAGSVVKLTPAQARARNADLHVLSSAQAATLESLADAIVPGAREAGTSNFIDSQLTADPSDSLLMIRYLGVSAPFTDFYLNGLENAQRLAKTNFSTEITKLKSNELERLIDQISSDSDSEWNGPPSSFFYFVLRSDAVDMVYGTEAGFDTLGIPKMLHIKASQWW